MPFGNKETLKTQVTLLMCCIINLTSSGKQSAEQCHTCIKMVFQVNGEPPFFSSFSKTLNSFWVSGLLLFRINSVILLEQILSFESQPPFEKKEV